MPLKAASLFTVELDGKSTGSYSGFMLSANIKGLQEASEMTVYVRKGLGGNVCWTCSSWGAREEEAFCYPPLKEINHGGTS